MPLQLNEDEIIERAALLPAFPSLVNDILQTLEDDNSTLGTLIHLVEREPVITAKVLSIANSAALSGHTPRAMRDMHVAVSLIGLARLREIVLGAALADFASETRMNSYFWAHSVAVGVACQELARLGHVSVDYALVAGVLHDIGRLWMARFYPLEFQMVRGALEKEPGSIVDIERRYFGVDHCTVGKVLATGWNLPQSVVDAIGHHHDAEPPADKLVAIAHVAEVIANALDLTHHDDARVVHLSADACALIGIDWQEDLRYLFGRIEARTEFMGRVFR